MNRSDDETSEDFSDSENDFIEDEHSQIKEELEEGFMEEVSDEQSNDLYEHSEHSNIISKESQSHN